MYFDWLARTGAKFSNKVFGDFSRNKRKKTAYYGITSINGQSHTIPSMRSLLFGAADIVAKTTNSNTTRNISRRAVTGIKTQSFISKTNALTTKSESMYNIHKLCAYQSNKYGLRLKNSAVQWSIYTRFLFRIDNLLQQESNGIVNYCIRARIAKGFNETLDQSLWNVSTL